MKFYWLLFKIKASKETENLYFIYRRIFLGKSKQVATVTLDPGVYYKIIPTDNISGEELSYLSNRFRKIAKLSGKTSMTDGIDWQW